MSMQDFLTYAFNAITLGFIAIALIDFFGGLIFRKQTPTVSPAYLSTPPVGVPEPVLISALALTNPEEQVGLSAEPATLTTKEVDPYNLALEDIAALKLRTARKVASALNVKQKVNGKDKSLDWLQREIRQRLINHQQDVITALEETRAKAS